MITTTIVTSKDGVGFSVSFHSRTEAQARLAEVAEANFARTLLACQLESFGDYHRVEPLSGYVMAPNAQAALNAGRRFRGAPLLTLIKGGKP